MFFRKQKYIPLYQNYRNSYVFSIAVQENIEYNIGNIIRFFIFEENFQSFFIFHRNALFKLNIQKSRKKAAKLLNNLNSNNLIF